MTAISIVLPPIAYASLVLILARNRSIEELLSALAKSHVVVFAFIAVVTEVLSAFNLIDFPALLGVWSVLCLSCITAVACILAKRERWRDIFSLATFQRISPLSIFLIGAIAFILATAFATAMLYPPNSWDSMAYHMARVANWINNHNVTFYPTEISRQNYQMPLAEFAIMHLQILSGSDLFANLVQWLCFSMSIGLGALIASELGLNKTGQLMSSALIATIPLAILQSSGTQNDLVASSFVLSFALFMLRLRKDFTFANVLFASLSLGLALLTKGTAYIYCSALGVCLAIPILFKARSTHLYQIRRIGGLAFVIFMALALNSGHYARCYRLYGTPISSGEVPYFIQGLSPYALLSNIPRNLALHLGTSSVRLNWYMYRGVQLMTGKQLNNPDTTWPGTSFGIMPYNRHEDVAGNPVHMLLTLFALASVSLWVRRKQQLHTHCYVVGVFLAALIYCGLKWHIWASGLHTPFFALSAPVIVVALTNHTMGARRYVALTGIVFAVLFSLPFALNNQSRSLLSQDWRKRNDRVELYFNDSPKLYESYRMAMHVVEMAGVRDVGLYLGGDDWEYPFWVFAEGHSHRSNIQFHNVGVNDQSKILQTEAYLPAYVIATKSCDTWHDRKEYDLVCGDENVSVLRKIGHNQGVQATQ